MDDVSRDEELVAKTITQNLWRMTTFDNYIKEPTMIFSSDNPHATKARINDNTASPTIGSTDGMMPRIMEEYGRTEG